MKKHFLKSFALLAMLFSALTMSAATQYCDVLLETTDGDVKYSLYHVSGNTYGIQVVPQDGMALTGIANPNIGVNQSAGAGITIVKDLWTISNNVATAIFQTASETSVPTNFFTAYICFNKTGGKTDRDLVEVTIPASDIDWTTTCGISDETPGSGEGGDDPVDPTPDPEDPEVTDKWANVDWVEASDNKYKVSHECLSSVVNVQQPSWAAEKGIYITAPASISDCTVNGKIDGAGMILYLSSFTAKETEVTINYAGGSCTFWVYYADGTEGGGETPSTPTEIYDVNFALASNGSSAEATSGNNPNEAIDNNLGSRWISEEKVDPQTWTLDLGQARIFNTLEIVWEGAYGKTFTVSVSDDKETWTPVWTVEGQELAGFPYTQTQTIDKTTARYIQFHGTERGTGYGYSFWEFRVYLAGTSVLASLEAKSANNITKVGETNVITLVSRDQNGQVMETPDGVTYTITPADAGTITGNVYTPAKIGAASIVASIGEVAAAAFEVVAYDGENLAFSADRINANKVIVQSGLTDGSDKDAWYAVDGKDGSVWQGSLTNGTANDEAARTFDSWFVVDFGAYYDINLVSIQFEGACSQEYHVDFSADNATWNVAYNYVGNAGINRHTKLIYGNDLQNTTKVRYARFYSTKAATEWGMKMFEFKVFGTPWVAPDDDVKPVMGTAELVSTTHNTAVIAVTATDNEEVGKYHVVSATPAYDKMVLPTDGKITVTDLTPSTEYTLTITAVDLAGNESENVVTVAVATAKYDIEPSALPSAPNYPANQVKAVYSKTYGADCNFGEWGSGTQYTQDTYGKKYVTTNLGYFGLFEFALNCSNMEALHLDVWTADDMSFRVVPIHGANEVGVIVNLKGQQWNSVEIPLIDYEGVPDWTNVYQIKIDNASNRTFWLNNIYFYTTQAPAGDEEAPTAVTATATASFFSVTIHAQATDNSGAVVYEVKNGEDVLASRTGVSAENTDIVVSNLTPNTDYNLTLVAKDESANAAEPVSIAVKTLEAPAPAPAPTHAAENVYAIYSDAYTSPVYFGIGGWGQATVATEGNLAAKDKAYLLQNTNYLGWEINNNQPFDVSAYNKVHLDVYALADGSLQFTPISLATPNNKENVQTLTLKEGWNQFDIDCATFTDVEFDKIIQVKFAEGGNATYFIDNVYFYKPAVGSAVENTQVEVQSHKLIRNGVLYIIRNGVTYDVMGRVVR